MSDLSVRKVGLLIKDAYEYPIYHVFGAKDTEYREWTCELSRNIRLFDGVTSIEKYLERIDQLRQPSPPKARSISGTWKKSTRVSTSVTKDALLFQELIRELLQALGFIDVIEPKGRDEGYDFQASYPINFAPDVTTQQSWIVEVKYVRSRKISADRIVSIESLRKLSAYALMKKVDKALLVT